MASIIVSNLLIVAGKSNGHLSIYYKNTLRVNGLKKLETRSITHNP